MKECPYCNELVGNEVNVCFNCGYDWILRRIPNKERREHEDKIQQKIHQQKELLTAQLSRNPKYEYKVEAIVDDKYGDIGLDKIQNLLTRYSEAGWKLHSVFTNELGKNGRTIGIYSASSGTNATIEQTVFIFERCVKAEDK